MAVDHRYLWSLRTPSSEPALTTYATEPVSDLSDMVVSIPAADETTEVAGGYAAQAAEEDELAYGRTVAFDWFNIRVRLDAEGAPMIVSGAEALLEDVEKLLLTPRFRVGIYGPDYGAEFEDLIGLDRPTAEAQAAALIKEALLTDPRVIAVDVLVDPAVVGDGGMRTVITITDFTGQQLDVPDVIVRYGGSGG